MTNSTESLDLSFIKSLFGSIKNDTSSTTPAQLNNVTRSSYDQQDKQKQPTQSQSSVQKCDQTNQNQAHKDSTTMSTPLTQQRQPVAKSSTIPQPINPQQHNPVVQKHPSESSPQQQNPVIQNLPSAAPNQQPWSNQARPDPPTGQQKQKAKRKEGKRQRLNRTKQKQKMNQYSKTYEATTADLDFDHLLAIHEKKTKAPEPLPPSAAISKQEATFVSNLLDSLSQSASTNQSESPPAATNHHKQAPNPQKKRKKNQQNQNAKHQKQGYSDLNSVHAMLLHEENGQSTTGKPSMVDIAHDIMGKPRKQPFNKRQQHNGQQKKPTPGTSDLICKFYLRGNCSSGTQCKFKHEGQQELTLCKFYKSGSCGNGANCTFSHDLQVEPCRFFFSNGGTCEAGDHCAFSHDPLTEASRKQLHRMTGPCRFYHFKGYCTNGDQCGFSHTEIDGDERRRLEQTLTPCRHFHTTGTCAKGDECFFLHAEASPESVRAFKESLVGKQAMVRPPTKDPRSALKDPRLVKDPRLQPATHHHQVSDQPQSFQHSQATGQYSSLHSSFQHPQAPGLYSTQHHQYPSQQYHPSPPLDTPPF